MLGTVSLHIGTHISQKIHWLFDPLYYFVDCQLDELGKVIRCTNEPYTYLLMPIIFVLPIVFFGSYFATKRMMDNIQELLEQRKNRIENHE